MKKYRFIVFLFIILGLSFILIEIKEHQNKKGECLKYYTYVPSTEKQGGYHTILIYNQKFETREDAIKSCME